MIDSTTNNYVFLQINDLFLFEDTRVVDFTKFVHKFYVLTHLNATGHLGFDDGKPFLFPNGIEIY